MLLPACTGTGLPTLVTDKSAESAAYTVLDAVLLPKFGSVVTLLATEAISVIADPEATVALTCTMNAKLAGELDARVPIEQL